jgi:starch phosphorylase
MKGTSTLPPEVRLDRAKIAYFSMEIAIDAKMKTYAGGLGILAGDMMKSATDLGIPMVGITLAYSKGYLGQSFDASSWQVEREDPWDPKSVARSIPPISLTLAGKEVFVGAWFYTYRSANGKENPIIFLDTDIPENSPEHRSITQRLYSGDHRHRLLQEAVLGIGGMKILSTLGATGIHKYHMNEGHSALLTLDLLERFKHEEDPLPLVKELCVFTTHTPVSAGHDQFPRALAEEIIGPYLPKKRVDDIFLGNMLNMTVLGLIHSGYVNGVAKRHGEVTREMFPGYSVDAITNGVHAGTWVSPSMKEVFDRHLIGWEHDPYSLRYALAIPAEELWQAHQSAKRRLFTFIKETTGTILDEDVFTIGFARRATPYKRAEFIFGDIERLVRIAEHSKGLQIVMAGKAHPEDHDGKLMIQRIANLRPSLEGKIRIIYLQDYAMEMAKLLVSGVDIWLNTPIRPQEASGTSGMKAALNGVPHLSILDGWWIEGHIEHVTGWSIGNHPEKGESSEAEDREDLYTKLEYLILPRYYSEREKWISMMRTTIAINGSFFHTHRMVEQYVLNAYFK